MPLFMIAGKGVFGVEYYSRQIATSRRMRGVIFLPSGGSWMPEGWHAVVDNLTR